MIIVCAKTIIMLMYPNGVQYHLLFQDSSVFIFRAIAVSNALPHILWGQNSSQQKTFLHEELPFSPVIVDLIFRFRPSPARGS